MISDNGDNWGNMQLDGGNIRLKGCRVVGTGRVWRHMVVDVGR